MFNLIVSIVNAFTAGLCLGSLISLGLTNTKNIKKFDYIFFIFSVISFVLNFLCYLGIIR